MSAQVRNISINVKPLSGKMLSKGFIDEIKPYVESFLASSQYDGYLRSEQIQLTWYDDFPTSDGISIGVNFTVLEGVDLAGSLIIDLRKKGYQVIGITIGY